MRTAVSILVVSAGALGSIVAGASAAPTRSAHAAAGPQTTVTGDADHPTFEHARARHHRRRDEDLRKSGVRRRQPRLRACRQRPGAVSGGDADGGKTWKTNGPALHLNAAQAPLAVVDIGAGGTKKIFAWGTGQVIDATPNGGKQWYRAMFNGLPVAVVKNPQGHLVAFVDGETSGSSSVATQYVSKDGGKTWHLDNTVGGS